MNWPKTIFLLFLAVVVFQAFSGGLIMRGDGLEYIVQTQSLVLQRQLRIDPESAAGYWNRTNPFGIELSETHPPADRLAEDAQAGGGFGGLYPDRAGHYRYYHFWLYSLAVAPLYAALHLLRPDGALEYHAFRIMNALFLVIPFLLAWRGRGNWPLLIVSVLALVSPLVPYVDWAHPELFCFCCVFSAFWLVKAGVAAGPPAHGGTASSRSARRLWWLGPVLLGAAASQNPPILAFFPLLVLRAPGQGVSWKRLAGPLAAGLAVGLSSTLYYRASVGVWNVIQAIGLADWRFASAGRTLDLFFSPLTGALWFYPACFLFLAACWRRGSRAFIAAALATVAAVFWVCSTTANFNAAQVGASRYAVWALAPLAFAVLNEGWLPARIRIDLRSLAFVLAAALSLALIAWLGTGRLLQNRADGFEACQRARPETAALVRLTHYPDDAETLAENILGQEIRSGKVFDGVYLWNLGRGQSLWIVSKKALEATKLTGWRDDRVPAYRVSPPNELFEQKDDVVRLVRGSASDYLVHPVLGPYVRVFMRREIRGIRSDVPTYVRGGNMP